MSTGPWRRCSSSAPLGGSIVRCGSTPKQKATIITSMLKNVGAGIARAAKLDAAGTLKYGTAEYLGVAEDAVGLANNENYTKLIPADIQAKVTQAAQDIKDGKIKVDTTLK